MKTGNIKFFAIKFIVLHIVNLIAFAVAAMTDILSGFLFREDQAFVQTALVCLVGFGVFAGYIYKSTAGMKESDLPPALFVIRETAAYMIFMIVPTVTACVVGMDGIYENLLMRFYIPNLALPHLLGLPIIGFMVQSLVFALIVMAAHAKNRRMWAAAHAEEERKRKEDEEYAEKLLSESEEE